MLQLKQNRRPYRQARWLEQYRRLKEYFLRHGHSDVPKGDADHSLALWVLQQRQRDRGKGTPLTPEQIALLDGVAFQLSPRQAWWEGYLRRLEQFKARFEHTRVPQEWPEDPDLGAWVKVQREWRRRGKLPQDRFQRLDDLGFVWGTSVLRAIDVRPWEQRLAELAAYRQAHGNCNVSRKTPGLGHFVHHARRLRKRGRLARERIAQLDALGFCWSRADILASRPLASARKPKAAPKPAQTEADMEAFWQARLRELDQYKQQHGHCDVPAGWPVNPALARWVRTNGKPAGRGNSQSSGGSCWRQCASYGGSLPQYPAVVAALIVSGKVVGILGCPPLGLGMVGLLPKASRASAQRPRRRTPANSKLSHAAICGSFSETAVVQFDLLLLCTCRVVT